MVNFFYLDKDPKICARSKFYLKFIMFYAFCTQYCKLKVSPP